MGERLNRGAVTRRALAVADREQAPPVMRHRVPAPSERRDEDNAPHVERGRTSAGGRARAPPPRGWRGRSSPPRCGPTRYEHDRWTPCERILADHGAKLLGGLFHALALCVLSTAKAKQCTPPQK